MPSATNINAAVVQRIRDSGLQLTVVYPPARAAATGTAPGPSPVSPLTGPAPAYEVIDAAPTPAKASVTVACLWLDASVGVDSTLHQNRVSQLDGVWLEGAQARARVVVADVLETATDAYGDTIFTGCDHVLYQGHRYKVLSVQPVGASFAPPATLYVWLVGASKQ